MFRVNFAFNLFGPLSPGHKQMCETGNRRGHARTNTFHQMLGVGVLFSFFPQNVHWEKEKEVNTQQETAFSNIKELQRRKN